MNSATANAKYIAGVAVHRAGGEFDMRYVYANPQRVNPILAGRDTATEFSNATEAQANANQAIREHAERGDFSQHMASAHVLTV